MSVYRQEEISLARASVSWPLALPLTPQVILLPLIFSSLPWKTPVDSTALSHLLAKSFFGEEFCPVAKSQREKEREQQNNDAFTPTAFALNPSQK